MKKKDFKTVLIVLAVILFGYVYLMGGVPRTVEQLKEGKYFNFEDKSIENKINGQTSKNILVKISNTGDKYCTTLNLNKRNELINFSGKTLSEKEINNLISKYSLNKINDYQIWEPGNNGHYGRYIDNPKYTNYEIIELNKG